MFNQENREAADNSVASSGNVDTDLKDTSRTEAFSDGVFAIAVTLLVLDLHLPSGTEEMSGAELWSTLLGLWPQFIAYVISFFFLGIGWINHHRVFSVLKSTNTALQLLNLVLLFVITALPFPTSVVADHLGTPGEQIGGLFYNAFFVLLALVFNALWRFARTNVYLHKDGNIEPLIQQISAQFRLGPLFYFVVLLVGLISVPLSLALHVVLAVFYALPNFRPANRLAS